MKKQSSKKLALLPHTLRHLHRSELVRAIGGDRMTTDPSYQCAPTDQCDTQLGCVTL